MHAYRDRRNRNGLVSKFFEKVTKIQSAKVRRLRSSGREAAYLPLGLEIFLERLFCGVSILFGPALQGVKSGFGFFHWCVDGLGPFAAASGSIPAVTET